jgi:hypothetical protein
VVNAYVLEHNHILVNVQTAANRMQHLQYFGILFPGHGNLLFDFLVFTCELAMVFPKRVFSSSVVIAPIMGV